MYVRAKTQRGRAYHYLVTAERQGGRVRQKTVAYLGEYPNIATALAGLSAQIEMLNRNALRFSQKADHVKGKMPAAWLERNGGDVPPRRPRPGVKFAYNLVGQYWTWREFAERNERRARELSARLRKLKALGESV